MRIELKLENFKEMNLKSPENVFGIILSWNAIGIGQVTGTIKQARAVDKYIRLYGFDKVFVAVKNYGKAYNDKTNVLDYVYSFNSFFKPNHVKTKNSMIEKLYNNGEEIYKYNAPNKVVLRKEEVPAKKAANKKKVQAIDYQSFLNSMKKMDYKEYLLSEHWIHFKTEAIRFSSYKCQLCNKDHTQLHVHHKTYDNRGRETFNDVIVLCADCHSMVHNKPK